MKKLLLIVTALTMCVGMASAQGKMESAQGKKNIMIIGPSNTVRYTPHVAEMMKDVAVVVHNEGNSKGTPNGIENIEKWLGHTKWDIILFSFGGWDIAYTLPNGKNDLKNGKIAVPIDQYVKNLEIIIGKLRKTGAQLIFGTMGYVPPGSDSRLPEDAVRYNNAAAELMRREGIAVTDVYEVAKKIHPKHGKSPTDVHYDEEGNRILAEYVAEKLQKEVSKINKSSQSQAKSQAKSPAKSQSTQNSKSSQSKNSQSKNKK